MHVRVVMDKAGRVVIPKPVREELQLEAGDALDLESSGEQVLLRVVRGTGPLTQESGVWVFRTGHPLGAEATNAVLEQIRGERDLGNLGKGR